jgi:hypothetical protein
MTPGYFCGDLLVFIAEGDWICSIELIDSCPHATFRRHFFIPSAWLSTSAKIIAQVTTNKDTLFVRGHELAVIGQGLEAAERISIS